MNLENLVPTSKPRITITLTEEQHAVLEGLSGLQGVSMSSIVVDLLETALPVLARVGMVIQAAKEAPVTAREKLRENLEAAENSLLPMMGEVMGQLDDLVEKAGGTGRSLRSGGRPGVAAKSSPGTAKAKKKPGPPTTNRGVRTPPGNPRKPSTGAASKGIRKGVKK